MEFASFIKKDGQVVVVNIAHIVALYEVGHDTRFVLSSGEEFSVVIPPAQVRTQIEEALGC